LQPSASARCEDGQLVEMALNPVQSAFTHGLVPLVYGDVALDDVRGGTIISTETIMRYLSAHVPVERILLLGEVEGVYDADGAIIPEVTPANIDQYAAALGGSSGTDVTGGMLTKVHDMLDLATSRPGLTVRIMDGRQPGLLRRALRGEINVGSLIHS
jgi:isopentenyl phosphate kinase